MAEHGRLAGKVAIVTGAGSRADGIGNGRATAVLLARNGARVTLVDTVRDWVQRTADMIEAEDGVCRTVLADVTNPEDCAGIVASTTSAWGRLDILVNNVGIEGPRGTAVEVDLEGWNEGLKVNVTSMMLMAKYAIPAMVAGGQGGAIVNIASYAGLFGGHPALLYPTSKGAVVNMTRAMAAHHAAQKVRVNCVAPGMVYTPMVYAGGMTAEHREARRARSLLKTEGEGGMSVMRCFTSRATRHAGSLALCCRWMLVPPPRHRLTRSPPRMPRALNERSGVVRGPLISDHWRTV